MRKLSTLDIMATETSSRRPHEVIAGRALVNLLSSIAQGIETPTSRLTDNVGGERDNSSISMNQGKKRGGKYSKKKNQRELFILLPIKLLGSL